MDFLSYLVKACWVSVQAHEAAGMFGKADSKFSTHWAPQESCQSGEGAAHSQHLTLNMGSPAQQWGTCEPEVRTGCWNPSLRSGFLCPFHSPFQMDQASRRSSRTSACESQHRWPQGQRTEQCLPQHVVTNILTLAPSTGNEMFMYLDVADEIHADSHLKDSSVSWLIYFLFVFSCNKDHSQIYPTPQRRK